MGLAVLAAVAVTAGGCSGGHHGSDAASGPAAPAPAPGSPTSAGAVGGSGSGSGVPTTGAPIPAACSAPPTNASLRMFCGRGTVSVQLGRQSQTIGGAQCQIGADSVSVNAGTLVLSSDPQLKRQYLYVGVQVGSASPAAGGSSAAGTSSAARSDGVYPALMSISDHGVVASVPHAQATLTSNRLKGMITGRSLSGAPVEVTYAC